MMMMRVEVSALCVCVHQEVVHWGGEVMLHYQRMLEPANSLMQQEARWRMSDGCTGSKTVLAARVQWLLEHRLRCSGCISRCRRAHKLLCYKL